VEQRDTIVVQLELLAIVIHSGIILTASPGLTYFEPRSLIHSAFSRALSCAVHISVCPFGGGGLLAIGVSASPIIGFKVSNELGGAGVFAFG